MINLSGSLDEMITIDNVLKLHHLNLRTCVHQSFSTWGNFHPLKKFGGNTFKIMGQLPHCPTPGYATGSMLLCSFYTFFFFSILLFLSFCCLFTYVFVHA